MREIKFRAWDDKKKEMIEMLPGDLGRPGFLMDFFANVFEAQTPGEDNMKLMQFTGFIDKDGREIYEGDVLTDHYNRLLQVIWRTSRFQFEALKETNFLYADMYQWFDGFLENPEVIGNIYENPELLKR